jgi:hypothetical protein
MPSAFGPRKAGQPAPPPEAAPPFSTESEEFLILEAEGEDLDDTGAAAGELQVHLAVLHLDEFGLDLVARGSLLPGPGREGEGERGEQRRRRRGRISWAGKFADSREKRKSRKRLRKICLPKNEKEAGHSTRPTSSNVRVEPIA